MARYKNIKKAAREWLGGISEYKAFATITFKQARLASSGVLVKATRDAIDETCCEVQRRVLKLIKKQGYALDDIAWITTIEDGHGEKRLHAHMAISLPSGMEFEEFAECFNRIVQRMEWCRPIFEIKQVKQQEGAVQNERIINYMLKEGLDSLSVNAFVSPKTMNNHILARTL
jgi:hypothetical protein